MITLKNLRHIAFATAIALLAAQAAEAASVTVHTKHHHVRGWHGYGFLPGYRRPEQIEYDSAHNRGPHWWYGYPRFYHGRWNGGGFGPCWTETPIGEIWNCGK